MQIQRTLATPPSAAAAAPPGPNPAVRNPIVGIYTNRELALVLRDAGPIGAPAGYGSFDEAVSGLAELTRGDASTAGIVQRDGRFHGMSIGQTSVNQLGYGGLNESPIPFGIRNWLFSGFRTSLQLIQSGLVGLVDGGYNDNAASNSGVRFAGTSLTLDERQMEQLSAGHHLDNRGRLIDLAKL
ncbi:MAG: hypothetical protein H7123_03335 [Thermoleophilia bacterium]|nr:hypothetical protein [Thermoleophilia bacterium]